MIMIMTLRDAKRILKIHEIVCFDRSHMSPHLQAAKDGASNALRPSSTSSSSSSSASSSSTLGSSSAKYYWWRFFFSDSSQDWTRELEAPQTGRPMCQSCCTGLQMVERVEEQEEEKNLIDEKLCCWWWWWWWWCWCWCWCWWWWWWWWWWTWIYKRCERYVRCNRDLHLMKDLSEKCK